MEKVLLVTALLGSVYLALRWLVKVGGLLSAHLLPKVIPTRSGADQMADTGSVTVRKDEEEDWSKYDVPAFIRRGIPMPVLKPVSAKHTKARKRRSKAKSNEQIVTAVSPKAPPFELVT